MIDKDSYVSFFDDCDDNPDFFEKVNEQCPKQENEGKLKELFAHIEKLPMCDWCNEETATIEIITTQGKWYICDKCMPVDGEIFPKCQKTLNVSEIDFSEAIRAVRGFLKSYRSDI
jgi:hypothetical protein